MAGLYITTKGFDLAENAIRKIWERGRRLKTPFTKIGRERVKEILRRMDEERTPDGHVWAALAPSTVKKRGSAHPILEVTHSYKDLISFVASNQGLAVGSNDFRSPILNLGGWTGRNHASYIPPRPHIGTNEADADRANDYLIEYMTKL